VNLIAISKEITNDCVEMKRRRGFTVSEEIHGIVCARFRSAARLLDFFDGV
jgi:hypothetical protein